SAVAFQQQLLARESQMAHQPKPDHGHAASSLRPVETGHSTTSTSEASYVEVAQGNHQAEQRALPPDVAASTSNTRVLQGSANRASATPPATANAPGTSPLTVVARDDASLEDDEQQTSVSAAETDFQQAS